MPLIKPTATTTTSTSYTIATATVNQLSPLAATTAAAAVKKLSTPRVKGIPTTTTTATETTTSLIYGTKSMPTTPVLPKPFTSLNFDSTPEVDYDAYDFQMHSYPNFSLDISDSNVDDNLDLDEDSSLAMITPPPPYDTPHHNQQHKPSQAQSKRKFLFSNREIFNISATHPTTPTTGRTVSAITPTRLSAVATAMFAAPQMSQLNRKWTNLHRKRRRRNSSSGDSKELDKLVLQSVDWDENDIY